MSSVSMPTAAPSSVELQLFGPPDPGITQNVAAAMILTMLDVGDGISDLIFSPGRPPQVEQHGELTPVADSAGADAAQAGAHGAHRPRADCRQRAGAADAERTRRLRPLVSDSELRAVPRQRFPAARHATRSSCA